MKFGNQCVRGILWISLAISMGVPALRAQAQDNPPAATGSQTAPTSTGTDKTQPNASPAQTPEKKSENKQEVSMQDTGPTFKVRVNLVQVRVVVRDSSDKPVENLKREDFLLYDQGKLQGISTFTVETTSSRRARAEAAAKTQADIAGKKR